MANSPFDSSSDEEGKRAAIGEKERTVAANFPDDFKQFVDTQLNRCPVVDDDCYDKFCGWVFWSREDDQSEHPPNILGLKKKIKDVLRKCLLEWFQNPTLIQFWAPTRTMDGRSYLTTQNQPFALCTLPRRIDDDVKGPVKGLCGYRMISMDYKVYMDRESSDEQLGVPGRVFKHGFREFTPNVEYYSIKEYPLRDQALRCQLKLSWVIPLFDPSTHSCVGVLDIVSTWPSIGFLLYNYSDCLRMLEEIGLESSKSHADHVKKRNVRQSEALDEISKVSKVVCKVHGLDFAQVWAPCRVDWACRALVKGDIFHVIANSKTFEYWKFETPNMVSHLRKGQGVVGRAFSSPNVLFCKDVTQLSIIDYPLAHYARYHKLGCCFAICLQSSCTGNDIYVLECFMPSSNKDYYGNQQTALRKILGTMKKNFRTFKLASGEELGGHLYIEEIPLQNGSVQMSQTTKSLPRPEPLQSGGEMTQLDLSNQQPMDALNNESNVVSAERSNIDVTCSQEKGETKRPKRVYNRIGVKIEIPLDDILQNSKKSINVAADNLEVSQSTLKRVCRRYGFTSWPPCNKNMVGSSQPSESSPGVDHQQMPQLSSDQPFSQALAAVVHANTRSTMIQDANIVTVKAKYINDIIIKFLLSLSSGLVELQQQIANRLHLEDGTYYVKYKDEDDDLIVIACDQDLQDYISSSKSLGSTTIMVFIVPK